MPSHLTWHDKLLDLRDRLLASERFQAVASAFPATRPIARRRASDLFDLCAGFVYSQILFACVKLDLFARLAEGPATAPALAARCAMPLHAMTLLLDAAVALQLVQRRSDAPDGAARYGLGPRGAALRGNPGVAAMIAHHAMLYGDLRDPLALLRGTQAPGELAGYWPYATRDGATLTCDDITPYTALMAASQPMIARQVLRAYDFNRHRCLLDVGGGDGSFLSAVLAANPNLRGVLFDLPAVAKAARGRFAADNLAARTDAVGGSFLNDALPQGADVISLVRVVHDHDDDHAMRLLRAARQALPQGGTLIIAEPIAQTPGAEAMGDAYFAFYLLAMGSGRPRSFAQLRTMLKKAGFDEGRMVSSDMPMLASVIVATATSEADKTTVNID